MSDGYTETITLGDELERLRGKRGELKARAADADPDSKLYEQLLQRGGRLDTHITGVEWARDLAHTNRAIPTHAGDGRPCPVWDEDVDELTFRALGGEFELIDDEVSTKAQANDLTSADGMARLRTIAYGTEQAPYHDPDATIDQRVSAVEQLPPAFKKWAEWVIVDISTLGNGPEQSFAAAVRSRRENETDGREE